MCLFCGRLQGRIVPNINIPRTAVNLCASLLAFSSFLIASTPALAIADGPPATLGYHRFAEQGRLRIETAARSSYPIEPAQFQGRSQDNQP
jgi:hypothetical protein